MRALRALVAPLLFRRALRALDQIDQRLAEQNRYLQRLAEYFAPAYGDDPADAQATGVDHLNPLEAARVLDYVAKTRQDTGRDPTDDEILRFLAEDETTDLHTRLERQR